MNYQEAWGRAIEDTQDPMAPFVLQEAYAKVSRLGRMLTACCTAEEVAEIQEELLSAWTEEGMNAVGGRPQFIVALAAILCSSLESYGRSLGSPELVAGKE